MQVQGYQKKTTAELLQAIDACQSISQVCALVQHEHIVIQMKSQQSASCLPKQQLIPMPDRSPLDSLKAQVKDAVLEAARRDTKEDILKAIDRCNTIVQIFQLVQKHNIVIQMKSQQSASCLPMQKLPPRPDTSPLDRLKEQVKDAVMNGG